MPRLRARARCNTARRHRLSKKDRSAADSVPCFAVPAVDAGAGCSMDVGGGGVAAAGAAPKSENALPFRAGGGDIVVFSGARGELIKGTLLNTPFADGSELRDVGRASSSNRDGDVVLGAGGRELRDSGRIGGTMGLGCCEPELSVGDGTEEGDAGDASNSKSSPCVSRRFCLGADREEPGGGARRGAGVLVPLRAAEERDMTTAGAPTREEPGGGASIGGAAVRVEDRDITTTGVRDDDRGGSGCRVSLRWDGGRGTGATRGGAMAGAGRGVGGMAVIGGLVGGDMKSPKSPKSSSALAEIAGLAVSGAALGEAN